MGWNDLTVDERLALAALACTMLRLDRCYSREESKRLHAIANELGEPEAFWEAIEVVEREHPEPEDARKLAIEVTRGAAQDFILQVLESLAAAETVSEAEARFLAEVRALWTCAPIAPCR